MRLYADYYHASTGGYDKLITGPKSIVGYWPSLAKAGFSKVDAAHPVPGKQYEAYFFSGTDYVRIYFKPGTLYFLTFYHYAQRVLLYSLGHLLYSYLRYLRRRNRLWTC